LEVLKKNYGYVKTLIVVTNLKRTFQGLQKLNDNSGKPIHQITIYRGFTAYNLINHTARCVCVTVPSNLENAGYVNTGKSLWLIKHNREDVSRITVMGLQAFPASILDGVLRSPPPLRPASFQLRKLLRNSLNRRLGEISLSRIDPRLFCRPANVVSILKRDITFCSTSYKAKFSNNY
jgi:hypothetical protein